MYVNQNWPKWTFVFICKIFTENSVFKGYTLLFQVEIVFVHGKSPSVCVVHYCSFVINVILDIVVVIVVLVFSLPLLFQPNIQMYIKKSVVCTNEHICVCACWLHSTFVNTCTCVFIVARCILYLCTWIENWNELNRIR